MLASHDAMRGRVAPAPEGQAKKGKSYQHFLERQASHKRRSQEQLETKRAWDQKLKEEQLSKDATFRPDINERSKNLVRNVDHLTNFGEWKQRKRMQQRLNQVVQEYEDRFKREEMLRKEKRTRNRAYAKEGRYKVRKVSQVGVRVLVRPCG